MTNPYQQVRAIDGSVSTEQFLYTDESGQVWHVPIGAGHRFETQYDEWAAIEGNVIAPPAA